jgi:DNA-binding transcriptional ArsR family regulator
MKSNNPYAALEKLFHEPARLAITSTLCEATEGVTFGDLKYACDLTDGNLNRHLKVLGEAGAVIIEKSKPAGGRPRTLIHLSAGGREGFLAYLQALEEVLRKAGEALESPSTTGLAPGLRNRVNA